MRTISLQRLGSPQHPRRKNQVRIPERVIRMQMSNKNNLQLRSLQSRNPIFLRGCRSPHHSRPAVDQISPIIHHHCHRRPPPLRIRARIPRPQHHHASRRRRLFLSIWLCPSTYPRDSHAYHHQKESRHRKPPCPRIPLITTSASRHFCFPICIPTPPSPP